MKIDAKKVFYAMLVVMFLSFGGIIAAFYWGNKQLEATANTISGLKTDNDIAQQKILALNKVSQGVERTEEAEQLLNTLLPKQKEQEKLVADVIYTAVAEAQIPIENIGSLTFTTSTEPSDLSGTQQSKEVPGAYSYPFTVAIQDISFDTLLVLLREIETNGRLVQVDNIQISPDKKAPGQISSINLSLKAFLKP